MCPKDTGATPSTGCSNGIIDRQTDGQKQCPLPFHVGSKTYQYIGPEKGNGIIISYCDWFVYITRCPDMMDI